MRFKDTFISRDLYQVVLEQYPMIKNDPELKRFLFFTLLKDREQYSREKLFEWLYDKPYRKGNPWALKTAVPELSDRLGNKIIFDRQWSDNGLVEYHIDPKLKIKTLAALGRDKFEMNDGKQINIANGRPVNINNTKKNLAKQPTKANPIRTVSAARMIAYLHSLSPRLFKTTKEARDLARKHVLDSRTGAAQISAIHKIWKLKYAPLVPEYVQAPASDRLFQNGEGIQGLPSDIRALLFSDWLELDLQNAHLAILCARFNIDFDSETSIWDDLISRLAFHYYIQKSTLSKLIPTCSVKSSSYEVQNAIATGTNRQVDQVGMSTKVLLSLNELGMSRNALAGSGACSLLYVHRKHKTPYVLDNKQFLQSKFKIEPTKTFPIWDFGRNEYSKDELKAVLKGAIYASCYGSSPSAVAGALTRQLDKGASRIVMEHKLIFEVVAHTQAEIADIKERKNFGIGRARSEFACEIQKIEQELISVLFADAIKFSKEYVITCQSHDGVSIKILKKGLEDRVINRLKKLIAKEADARGIKTKLTAEKPKPIYVRKTPFFRR